MKKSLLMFMLSVCMSVMTFAQVDVTITNPAFELPDDGIVYKLFTAGVIPGWQSDEITSDYNGRGINNEFGDKYMTYCRNLGLPVYQAVDKIAATSVKYDMTFLAKIDWNPVTGDELFVTTYFWRYSIGSNIKNRVLIDSVNFSMGTTMGVITKCATSITIPSAAAYAGDSLVIGISLRSKNPANTNSWLHYDSIKLAKTDIVTGFGEKNSANNYKVYPNPSTGLFTLEAKSLAEVSVSDMTGKIIYSAKPKGDKTNINITTKGIYMLHVKSNGTVSNQKLIVK